MNILLVHNAYKIPGGEDTVVDNELRLLQRAGHHVFTYFRSNTELDSYSLPAKLLFPFRAVYSQKSYRDVSRLIKEHHIDLVHIHNTLSVISPSVCYAALDCRVPVVQTLHNFRLICPNALLLRDGHICTECLTNGLQASVKHACYRGSKLQTLISALILRYHRHRGIYRKISYICLTEFNKEMILRLNQSKKESIDPQSIYIKPNFCNRPALVIPYRERTQRFLYVSRMETAKGIDVLLDAWTLYERRLAECPGLPIRELSLCGSGPKEAEVLARIRDGHLTHVHFLGQVPHDTILSLMADSLAVLLPTMWYEGFPMTIAESYACHTPVIGSDIGNTASLVTPGITGCLFPPGDHAALCDILLHWNTAAQDSCADGAYLSEQAGIRYEECYTPERNLEQLLAIYRKVTSQ